MKYRRIMHLLPLTLLVFVLFNAATLFAGESSSENDWEFGAEVYLWGASIGGDSASGSDVDIDFGDLIDNLEMAFMGTFAARNGKWSILADTLYLDVKDKGSIAGIPGSVELTSWVVTPDVGYTVLDGEWGFLDLHLGARYLYLKADIRLGSAAIEDSGDNWDGIVGIRGKLNVTDKFYLPYYLDIGAGDSEMTWQASAGLGYQLKHFDVVVGYRYLEWDFDGGPVLDNLNLSGPYGGLRFYF